MLQGVFPSRFSTKTLLQAFLSKNEMLQGVFLSRFSTKALLQAFLSKIGRELNFRICICLFNYLIPKFSVKNSLNFPSSWKIQAVNISITQQFAIILPYIEGLLILNSIYIKIRIICRGRPLGACNHMEKFQRDIYGAY